MSSSKACIAVSLVLFIIGGVLAFLGGSTTLTFVAAGLAFNALSKLI